MHKAIILISALVLGLAGCASVPRGGEESPGPASGQRMPDDPRSDLMYDVLVGELAGQMGDLDRSIEYYLKAANASPDPRIAERATRIAVYANRPEPALAAAKRWVELEPGSLDAQQTAGVLYVRANQPAASLPHFERVIEATQGMHGGGFPLIGSLLARDAEPTSSLEAMRMLVANHPDDPMAQQALASLALRAESFTEAEAAADRALQLDPSLIDAKVVKARALFGQGNVDEAIAAMQALVAEYPENTELRLTYARMLVQAQRYDDALAQFEQVVDRRPGDGDLLYTVALLSVELQRLDVAEEYFLRVLDTGRHVNEAQYYLGRIAEERGEYKMAIAWYIKVVEGEFALEAQSRIASMLAKLGHVDKAREHLAQLRDQTHDDNQTIRLYLVEGQLLNEAGQYQEAMDLYSQALTLFPAQPDVLYARALVAEKLDRLDILEADLRSVLERDPENASALNALGYTLADRTQRYQEALDYISRAYQLNPEDPAIMDSMGWIQFRLGNYEQAENFLREAYHRFPDGEVAAHLVEVLWVKGEHGEARSILEQALSQDPEHDYLLGVKQRLGL